MRERVHGRTGLRVQRTQMVQRNLQLGMRQREGKLGFRITHQPDQIERILNANSSARCRSVPVVAAAGREDQGREHPTQVLPKDPGTGGKPIEHVEGQVSEVEGIGAASVGQCEIQMVCI